MTSSPAPDLGELRKLAEAATAGPWTTAIGPNNWVADWAYVHALVNAAPALLQEVRAAREAAARLTAYQEAWLDEHVALDAARIAESGRLREVLRAEHSHYRPVRTEHFAPENGGWGTEAYPTKPGCPVCALLATPPAPSDHGALDVERLAALLHDDPALCRKHSPHGHPPWMQNPLCRSVAERLAAEYARLATPSVSPEEGT